MHRGTQEEMSRRQKLNDISSGEVKSIKLFFRMMLFLMYQMREAGDRMSTLFPKANTII
jgi:hypothetical protein